MSPPQTIGFSNLEAFHRILAQAAENQVSEREPTGIEPGGPGTLVTHQSQPDSSSQHARDLSEDEIDVPINRTVLRDEERLSEAQPSSRSVSLAPSGLRPGFRTPPQRLRSVSPSLEQLRPFKRQTTRWTHVNFRTRIRHHEDGTPNEDWTDWKPLNTSEERGPVRFVLMQDLQFDEWEIKRSDSLMFWYRSALLKFLRQCRPELFRYFFQNYSSDYRTIEEKHYMALYHGTRTIAQQVPQEELAAVWQGLDTELEILRSFLGYVFPQRDQWVFRTGRAQFKSLHALFEPHVIVYEKRLIPPFGTPYEQCFRLIRTEQAVRRHDNASALCLIGEEVIYDRDITSPQDGYEDSAESGECLARTNRYIAKFEGWREITGHGLGFVPWHMLPLAERDAIVERLCERSRTYLQLSRLQFSIWDYSGPYSLVRDLIGDSSKEDISLSSAEQIWQVCGTPTLIGSRGPVPC
ncbi:hypothetical protein OQA88_5521 [Cercophora sp. LCS_1]